MSATRTRSCSRSSESGKFWCLPRRSSSRTSTGSPGPPGPVVMMVLYEVFWVRYFRGEQTMQSFYSSLLGIPVAGATLPVLAFLLLAIYGKNPILGVAVLILGIGHIGIHWMHRKELEG